MGPNDFWRQDMLAAESTAANSSLPDRQTRFLPGVIHRAALGLRHGAQPPDEQVMCRKECVHTSRSQQGSGASPSKWLHECEQVVRGTVAKCTMPVSEVTIFPRQVLTDMATGTQLLRRASANQVSIFGIPMLARDP